MGSPSGLQYRDFIVAVAGLVVAGRNEAAVGLEDPERDGLAPERVLVESSVGADLVLLSNYPVGWQIDGLHTASQPRPSSIKRGWPLPR